MDYDILIIGAGVLGLSSAYHMKRRRPEEEILVVDKFGSPGQGNSAKSEGGFRNLFTSKVNYMLADSSIEWFKHLEEELGYDINYNPIGYLWLFSEEQHNRLKGALDDIRKRDIEITTLDKAEIKKTIPDLVTDFEDDDEAELLGLEPVDIGIFGHKCGSLDADALVRSYEKEFIKLGGEVRYNTKIDGLLLEAEDKLGIPGEPFVWQNVRVAGAGIGNGEIRADKTVVAAGVWSQELLCPIGFDPLMRGKKRQLFSFKEPKLEGLLNIDGLNEEGVLPLTILPKAGIFLKAEPTEGSIWLGCADELGRKFGLEDDPQPEESYYTDNIYHALVNYFPCFSDVRPMNMWAGQYAINTFDETPVAISENDLIYIGAASGSGIMKADALGRIVASLHLGEEKAELFGGKEVRVSDIGIEERCIEREKFVI